jgi:uncharacterized membrane protein YeaQ/YmgE (transglycosylase-associated protein family)
MKLGAHRNRALEIDRCILSTLGRGGEAHGCQSRLAGAVIAGWLLPLVGLAIGGGIIAAVINAIIGAVILLFVIGQFKK